MSIEYRGRVIDRNGSDPKIYLIFGKILSFRDIRDNRDIRDDDVSQFDLWR